MLHMNTYTSCFFQFLVYKTQYEALQRDTMTAHDRDQQSELREFIINMYSISTDLFCPRSLNNGCMDGETLEEKKKEQKKDGTLNAPSSTSKAPTSILMMTPLRRSHVGSIQNGWIVRHAQIQSPGGGYMFS